MENSDEKLAGNDEAASLSGSWKPIRAELPASAGVGAPPRVAASSEQLDLLLIEQPTQQNHVTWCS